MIGLPLHSAASDELRIAVASNFKTPMTILAENFKNKTGSRVVLAFGSTGKHFSQIINGAPFDAFFAADTERPRLLENKGLAVKGSRFTYATGKLVLWSSKPEYLDSSGNIQINSGFNYIAIANPDLAPYGKAAQQVLQKQGVWTQLQDRLVRGENIAQTFQFAFSGNAQLGFLAYSQVKHIAVEKTGFYRLIEPSLYYAIEQQAVLLKDKAVAHQFMEFVKSEPSRAIIRDNGYDTP